jgi:hypothetical protein
MPIYKGGTLFLGAIDSVERSNIPFGRIVISFNESSSEDFNLFERACAEGRFTKDYLVLRTKQELNSLDHSIFITDHLSKIPFDDLKIFFLAHDDRILNTPGDSALIEFLGNARSDTIYFPSYSCCNAKDYSYIFDIVESNQHLSSNNFFWLTQRQNVPTSMTGMIVPIKAWIDSIRTMQKAGSGARFEHILCIARCINFVNFSTCVRVLVAQRENSEADQLNAMNHRISTLHYTLAFINNGRLSGFSNSILYSWILFKKLSAIVVQIAQDKFMKFVKYR